MAEERDAGHGDEREPDHGERVLAMVAEHLGGERVPLALVGNDERAGAVDDDPGAAEQRQHDEADAVDDGVDVEVPAEAAADAGEHTVGAAPMELPECGCLCHAWSVLVERARVHPASP